MLADSLRDLTLVDATLADGRRFDVTLAGGRIADMGPAGNMPTRDGCSLTCGGRLLVPSFVEGHVHLDKTLLGLPLIPHRPGPARRWPIASAARRSYAGGYRCRSRSAAAG